MKLFKNIEKGKLFQIIGYIVFFTCWIVPQIFTEVFNASGHIGLIVMVGQMGIGGFLMLFGNAINKRESSDPNYKIPKNIFRVFKAWQILLIITAFVFILLIISILYEFERMNTILIIVMYGLVIATAVVGTVQYQKNKKNFVSVGGGKMIRANSPTNSLIKCSGCNKVLNSSDRRFFEGKCYCDSCFMEVIAKRGANEGKSMTELQTKCHICGRAFPKSDFHVIDEHFICESCFQKEFGPNVF